MSLTNVLIIDDHPLFRDALSTAIHLVWPQARHSEAASIDEAIELLDGEHGFDIAMLDLSLPGVQGFDGLLTLRTRYPRLPVLVVSGFENEPIIADAIRYGAAGFLPKSLGREVLADAVNTVLDGGVYVPHGITADSDDTVDSDKAELIRKIASLTPAQARVLSMLREGMLNKQIAHELDVGATTVKKHVSEILRKLDVHSRTQAVIEVSKLEQTALFDALKDFDKRS